MTIAAVLLAAGSGSRFDGPTHKLLAPWGSSTVFAAALGSAVAAGFDEVLVVTGAQPMPVPDGVSVVDNPAWADGQATSLRAGLDAAAARGHEAVVVGLADQPAVTADTWRAVGAVDAPIVAARYAAGRRPPIRLRRDVWELLPASGDEGARALMAAHPELVIDVAVDDDPRDVDRPADLLTDADVAYVTECLGRTPRAAFTVAARDDRGRPTVIENPPFLDDGTPMPTRHWLIDPDLIRRIGTLEASGGVNEVEAELGLDLLAEVHARSAAAREALIPPGHVGPRPSGGVGGTRIGVKCLHVHYAARLAGQDDPVGDWVHARLVPTDTEEDHP